MNRPKLASWLGAFALTMVAPAASPGADPEVRSEGGRLWVRSEGGVAVSQLLESVSGKTGVELVVDPELAGGRMDVEIEGVELERALRELSAGIPGAAGHTMSYVEDGAGKPRVTRVIIFAAGKAPAGNGSAEAAAVAAPTPSSADLDAQRERLIESGVRAETARRFMEITAEIQRLEKTPGAAEEILRSENYRSTIREIAEAQGKVRPRAEEPPAP
ncbi:MAG: hypothetical protein ACREQ9_21090 [Candidatus Binatia bacterium]